MLVLGVLATASYVTATFMVEAIAGVNALKKRAREMEMVIGEHDVEADAREKHEQEEEKQGLIL